MKNIEISIIFLSNNLAEFFLSLSGDVLGRILVDSVLLKQITSLLKC